MPNTEPDRWFGRRPGDKTERKTFRLDRELLELAGRYERATGKPLSEQVRDALHGLLGPQRRLLDRIEQLNRLVAESAESAERAPRRQPSDVSRRSTAARRARARGR